MIIDGFDFGPILFIGGWIMAFVIFALFCWLEGFRG